MDNQDGRLWLPGGATNTHERQVADAIKEYDRELILGQRSDGEWVVFFQPESLGADRPPFPVLGLGFELPSADQVKEKLYMRDTKKNGKQLYAQILRRMDDGKKAADYVAEQGIGQAAEGIESAYRRLGGHYASPRIFVPRGI